jgi:hypothetical protein
MNPNRGDAVVRVQAFQRRFFQQDEIGDFPRLDGSELRIDFELPCVVDRSGSENLFQRQLGLLQLLHLQTAIQTGEISVGRTQWSVRAKERRRTYRLKCLVEVLNEYATRKSEITQGGVVLTDSAARAQRIDA